MSSLPQDPIPEAIKELATIANLEQYSQGDFPGQRRWLEKISKDWEWWVTVTLSYYAPLDLRPYEAEHLVRKVYGYLGPRPASEEDRLIWDEVHHKVVAAFYRWLPTLELEVRECQPATHLHG